MQVAPELFAGAPRALLVGIAVSLGLLLAAMSAAIVGLDELFAYYPALSGPCLIDNHSDDCRLNDAGRLDCASGGALLNEARDTLVLPVTLDRASFGDALIPPHLAFAPAPATTRAAGCRWTYLSLDFRFGEDHHYWQGPVNMSLHGPADAPWVIELHGHVNLLRTLYRRAAEVPFSNPTFSSITYVASADRHFEPFMSYATARASFRALAIAAPFLLAPAWMFARLALRPVRRKTALGDAAIPIELSYYAIVAAACAAGRYLHSPALAPTADDRAPPLDVLCALAASAALVIYIAFVVALALFDRLRSLDIDAKPVGPRGWLRPAARWFAWPAAAFALQCCMP